MAELLDVLNAFSYPLKVGWVVWAAWGIGQVFWYRQERKPQSAPRPATVGAMRKAAAATTPVEAPVPVVHRLITPEPTLAPTPVIRDAPAFDPSTAVVETFGAPNELDSFVADFERNTRQRRQSPHQPSASHGFASEAPQSM